MDESSFLRFIIHSPLTSYPIHALLVSVDTIDMTVDEVVERPRRVPDDMLGTTNRSKLSIVDLINEDK